MTAKESLLTACGDQLRWGLLPPDVPHIALNVLGPENTAEQTRQAPDALACCPAVKRGDRIAQLILERIMTPEVVEVEDLEATVRGAGGFGSTGVGSLSR